MAMVTVSDWFLGIQQQSCRPGGGGRPTACRVLAMPASAA
jgi:hypothetical protein